MSVLKMAEDEKKVADTPTQAETTDSGDKANVEEKHRGGVRKTKKSAARRKPMRTHHSVGETHKPADRQIKPKVREIAIPKWVFGVVAVLVLVVGAAYILGGSYAPDGGDDAAQANMNADVVEKGDVVTVEYTGRLANGTVFDTSNRQVAEDNRIYNPLRGDYGPISFQVGDPNIIQGFSEAVVGMKVGEEKEFTLTPEKAYGYPRKTLIQTVPRLQKSPITQNVSIEQFREDIGVEPYVGLDFSLENKTEYELDWPMKVLAVYNDTVTFRYFPKSKIVIQTVFGEAEIYGTEDSIVVHIKNVEEGQKIVTVSGPARVVDVNEENITLDFNHELAGQTLKFNVKVTEIQKHGS